MHAAGRAPNGKHDTCQLGVTHLNKPAHTHCQIATIGAEFTAGHWAFEGEVVQQHLSLAVNEQRAAILVHRQEECSIWADTQDSNLRYQ